MASDAARQLQYEYKANSNLVLPSDTSLIDRRPQNEATGEVQSLASRLTGKMGDKAIRSRPPQSSREQQLNKKKSSPNSHREESSIRGLSIAEADTMAYIYYKPTKPETKMIYESLLTHIQRAIGDQPRDILCGAADEVLKAIRNQNSVEAMRRNETESLIGKLNDEKFAKITDLCRRLTDYGLESQKKDDNMDMGDFNEAEGVNVHFGDSDDDNDSFIGEVNEDDDEELDGADADAGVVLQARDIDHVAGPVGKDTLSRDRAVKDQLHPRDIDAHWLQRELSKAYSDPIQAQEKARSTLLILKEAPDDRSLESDLIKLLGVMHFDFIKILRRNRRMIVHCIELASAQTVTERDKVRSKMLADPELSKILRSLEGDSIDNKEESILVVKQKSQRKLDEPMDIDENQGIK